MLQPFSAITEHRYNPQQRLPVVIMTNSKANGYLYDNKLLDILV